MESDFLKHKHFSKLMGEGSDLDESDDDSDLLDSMRENQNMKDAGTADQPLKLDTSLMSESMIKLVRTIEERIDKEKVGPLTEEQNLMPFPSVQETGEPPVTYCNDFDGDPSVINDNKYQLITDIEQGLNYLYDNGDAGIVSEENTNSILAANPYISHQILLNKNCKDVFLLDSLRNNDEPSRLHSKIVKHHLYDSSKLPESTTKRKSSGLGSEIKKRLGVKVRSEIKQPLGDEVKEDPTKLFQCKECGRTFAESWHLQQHLASDGHRRRLEEKTLAEKKRLSRKSREDSLPYDRPAKLKKFSSDKRDLSPEKKVICQHCQTKFFSLENLLYHLRAEHKNRKNHLDESAHRTNHTRSKEKGDYSLQGNTKEKIELSGSESDNDVSRKEFACSLCSKEFIESDELDNHLRLAHRDAFISDRHKFVCNLCRNTYLTKYDLIQHTEKKHYNGKTTNAFKVGESPKKRYECEFCHVTFLKWPSLKYHLKMAHNQ